MASEDELRASVRSLHGAFHGGLVPGFARAPSDFPLREERPTAAALLLGRDEVGSRTTIRAAITEANATMIFMYVRIGIVRAATAGCDDGSSSCVFASPAVASAVGFFVLIALLTYAFAAPSGAHMNPSVTLATVLIGHTTVYRYLLYAIMQCVGAVLGVFAMRATLGWEDVTPAELGECQIGSLTPGGAVVANTILFHMLLCVIGGIAFDPIQAKVFGPVLAPIFIAAAIGLIIFASSFLADGFGPMLNPVECFSIGIVGGKLNGTEWIAFVGTTLGAISHSLLYITIPPSHQESGNYRAPLLAPLYRFDAARKESRRHDEGEYKRKVSETEPLSGSGQLDVVTEMTALLDKYHPSAVSKF